MLHIPSSRVLIKCRKSMRQTRGPSGGNAEIMNFIATRFLNYKRIDQEIFLELLNENFPDQDARRLIQSLVDEKILKTYNGHLVLINEDGLGKSVYGYSPAERKAEV